MTTKRKTTKRRPKMPAGRATWMGGVVLPRLPWLARVADRKLRDAIALLVVERQVVRAGDVDAKALTLFDTEAQADIDAILASKLRGAEALCRVERLSLLLVRAQAWESRVCPSCCRPMPPSRLAACRAEDDAEDDRADAEPTKATPLVEEEEEVARGRVREAEGPLPGLDPCHESRPCEFLGARIAARLRGERVEPIMAILEPSEGWWAASIPSMPGRFSQGRTIPSALVHLADAMRGLDALEREGPGPAATKKARTVTDVVGGYIGSDGRLHKGGRVE
jgi:predicted RNase H-like HicB family nuclease